MRRSPVATVAIVALLLTSMVALPLGTGLAIAQGPPDHSGAPDHAGPPDHAGVPTDNINVDRRGSSAGGPPDDVSAWGVSASRHSESLGVEVRLRDGELEELVLSDDVNHAGREVAVDATALVAALPDVDSVDDLPDRVWGLHETEGRWSRDLRVEDGSVVVEIPHFSTNRVSFTSTYSISGEPGEDGATFTYDVGSVDSVSDLSVDVSGVETTKTDSFDVVGATNGDTIGYSVGGNTAPRDATVTLTGKGESVARGPVTITDSGSATVDPQGNRVEDATVAFTGSRTAISREITGTSDGVKALQIGGNMDPTGPANGKPRVSVTVPNEDLTSVRESSYWVPSDFPSGEYTVKFESERTGSDDYTFEIVVNGNTVKTETVTPSYQDVSGYFVATTETTVTLSPGDTITGANTDDEVSWLKYDTSGITTTISTASDSATLTSGGSTSLDISNSDSEVDITTTGGELSSYSLEYNDITQTDDPSLTVDGETVSHTGTLADGETVTKTLTGLTPGSYTADVSVSGPLSTSVEWKDITETTDPSVSIGSSTVSHTGVLGPGETVSEPVNLTPGVDDATVSVTGPVDVSGSWTEVTQTTNPSVAINGESDSYTGTLADGETVSLSPPQSAITNGTNTVTLGVDSPSTGPVGMARLNYSHKATVTESVTYSGNSFNEVYSVARTWPSNTSGATAVLPFSSDAIVGVGSVEVTRESPSETETVTEPAYEWDAANNSVVVPLGDVEAGTTTTVSASARKLSVEEGAITVVNPSSASGDLSSRVRIDETGANGEVVLDVSGIRQTREADRLPYVTDPSWIDAETHVELEPGTVRVVVEDGSVGEEFTVSTGDLGARSVNGDAIINVIDPEEPRFRLEPGATNGDVVEITYYPAKTGALYQLFRASDDVIVDTKEASSPVTLRTTDTAGVFLIQLSEEVRGFALGAASSASSGDGLLPPWLLLILGVVGAIGALALLSRRVEGDRLSTGRLPITLGVGGLAVVIVAVEVATPYSLIGSLATQVIATGVRGVTGSFAATLATIGVLVGLVLLQRRTETEIPLPILGAGGLLSVVWLFESLAPGSITGPLSSALEEVGAAVVILGILSVVALVWLWLRSRRPEIVIGGSS